MERKYDGEILDWEATYEVEGRVLCTFFDIMKRLYNDCQGFKPDEMRDMAQRMDAVLQNSFQKKED